jgi:DNA-binding response OmpR family regulator
MAKTILIIEDDDFLLGLEASKLTKKGYEVMTAANGTDALKTIGSNVKLDLILLDLMLPDVDGFMVLEKIRDNKALLTIPVIVFSNLSEDKDVARVKKLGVSDFMIKSNFTLDELAEKVKSLIGE